MDYSECDELSWCPCWLNSLWQVWSCGLVHCPCGNATDPIWRVLASSLEISSWTLWKPQHSHPILTLWPINSGVLTSLLLPHLSSSLTDSLPSLNLLYHSKTDARFMQDAPKSIWSIPYVSMAFFPSLKQNFIAYRSSKVSDCIFEIHQLWQSGFNRGYSNSCCSSSFEFQKNIFFSDSRQVILHVLSLSILQIIQKEYQIFKKGFIFFIFLDLNNYCNSKSFEILTI